MNPPYFLGVRRKRQVIHVVALFVADLGAGVRKSLLSGFGRIIFQGEVLNFAEIRGLGWTVCYGRCDKS